MADAPPLNRWDERYTGEEYFFGTEPNDFLAEVADRVPRGDVLCLADGEGRNGVYLATLGNHVTSIDASSVALDKANKLAAAKGTSLTTIHADLAEYDLGEDRWDCIVCIFFHMQPEFRRTMHARVARALKPGGYLILEAYTPEQLKFRTGGPPVAEMLQTLETLQEDFPDLEFVQAEEKEREVHEGKGHAGHSSVVQLLARKPEGK